MTSFSPSGMVKLRVCERRRRAFGIRKIHVGNVCIFIDRACPLQPLSNPHLLRHHCNIAVNFIFLLLLLLPLVSFYVYLDNSFLLLMLFQCSFFCLSLFLNRTSQINDQYLSLLHTSSCACHDTILIFSLSSFSLL